MHQFKFTISYFLCAIKKVYNGHHTKSPTLLKQFCILLNYTYLMKGRLRKNVMQATATHHVWEPTVRGPSKI